MSTNNNWHGGKGSKQRPTNREKFNDNYDAIFGKKSAVDDAADVMSKFESWTCECPVEKTTLEVEKGASCNWCGRYEDGTLD